MELELKIGTVLEGDRERGFFRCDLPSSNSVCIEFSREMKAVVNVMCPGRRFVCPLDGVVAAIYPPLQGQLKAYYEGHGPSLSGLLGEAGLASLDKGIALRIRACALIAQQVEQASSPLDLRDVLRSMLSDFGR